MSQAQLDFSDATGLPQGAVAVNRRVWFQDLHGNRAVFVDQTPFYCYPVADDTLHRFCAVQLVEAGAANVKQVCQAFQFHPRKFSRMRSRFRKEGITGLVLKKAGRKSKQTPTLAAGIVQLYLEGSSTRDIAEKVGLSPATVGRVLKDQGVELRSPWDRRKPLFSTEQEQVEPERKERPANEVRADEPETVEVQSTEPETLEFRTDELQPMELQIVDSQTIELQTVEPQTMEPKTVEATSIPYASPLDRFFTVMGLIEEAPVEFESAEGVPQAGVLLGLALLEETHLLQEARAVYGQLKNSWYGLRSLLWMLVVMALLRVKRPEQLKHHDPAGLGVVLGLPRAAEVKTVRRKLHEIALREKAAEWHRRLAQRRAEQRPSELATLYIDGHVRAYHGKRRLGQTRVTRLKRVMRAETDYWVHQADGEPLLVVHESVDASFHDALRDRVLPEIRNLVRDRRVRVVFDREGWSQKLFDDLLRLNFDFLTYRKGPYDPVDESLFRTVTFQPPGQPPVSYELAETTFDQEGWPRLRLVAVKKKNGGQTHVVATGRLTWEALDQEVTGADFPAEEIAWWMFQRWSQENWFKYMMSEYALDVLVDYSVELDDVDRLVVNPQWRELDRQVASLRNRLQQAQAKYATLLLKTEGSSEAKSSNAKPSPKCDGSQDCGCLSCVCRSQLALVQRLTHELDRLRGDRRATPRKIPLGEVSDRDPVKLSYERKLFTDTVKLSAYEIETRLYGMLPSTFCRGAFEGRGLIQEFLQASGDLRVSNGIVEVHLDQLSAPRYTEALQSICTQMNATNPTLPETTYGLRFFVKPRPIEG
jgi:transposase